MRYSEVAQRYAKALFYLAKENGTANETHEQLKFLSAAIKKDQEILDFLTSPLVTKSEKEKVFTDGLNGEFSGETKNFLLLLAKKGRVHLIPEIVIAFQTLIDEANSVTRGKVRSATVLSEVELDKIKETVSKITNKKVILTFEEDKSLIGGLVAEVGSFTFDDSLTSHMARLNEELNRRG